MPRLQERRAQRFRAAEATDSSDTSTPPAPSDEAAERGASDSAATDVEWFDMEDAPRTGAVVILRGPDGEMQEAVWAAKRKWNPTALRWTTEGAWYVHNAGGARVPFEPIAWARSAL